MTHNWQQNLLVISLMFVGSSSTNFSALATPIEQLEKPAFSLHEGETVPTTIHQAQAETEQSSEEVTGQLTPENISQVLTQIGQAGEEQNVEAILEHVAPFAHSEVSLNMGNTTLTSTLHGIEEHRNLLTQSYDRFTNRNTLNQEVDIIVSADGEYGVANVYRLREVTNKEGTRLLSGSINTLRFGMVNDRPTIVSATLEGWLSERPPEAEQSEDN